MINAEAELATAVVVIVNVAVFEPAGTVTLAGTTALVLPDLRETTSPPGPAFPLNVTVPVELLPPTTEVGDKVMLVRAAGVMVSVADCVDEPRVALTVAAIELETAVVVMVKVVESEPAGIVTEAGVAALVTLDDNVTSAPPGPAAPFKLTVPVEDVPPRTDVGETVRALTVGGVMVRVDDCVDEPRLAVITAVVDADTAVVFTRKVAEVDPAATETVAGTVAEVESLDNFTTVPPAGAVPVKVTVPFEEIPPSTLVGERETLDMASGLIVKAAEADDVPRAALIVAEVTVVTAAVLTTKFAEVEPAFTVTVAGTFALAFEEVRLTTFPPVGAA